MFFYISACFVYFHCQHTIAKIMYLVSSFDLYEFNKLRFKCIKTVQACLSK